MKLRKIQIREMNKKGSAIDILVWMVIAIGIIMFFGLMLYMWNKMTDVMVNLPSTSKVNISDAVSKTFVPVNTAQNTWIPILGYVMLFSMALSILFSNFLVKAHPAFLIVYVLITIGAIIASVYLSNYYETFIQNPEFAESFQTRMKGGTFIILNLPYFVTVIGLFGAIFLLMGILRDRGAGGGIG